MAKTEIHRLSSRQVQIQGRALACRLPRLLAPVDFWLSQRRLFQSLCEFLSHRDVSVVYTTDASYSGLFGCFIARRLRCPLIVAVWGNWDEAWHKSRALAMPRLIPSKRIQDLIINFVLKRADHVVVGNQDNLEYVVAHGAQRSRTSVVSTSKFLFTDHFNDPGKRRTDTSILTESGLPEHAKPLIYVGRLVSEKFPDDALDAIIRVVRQDSTIYGLLAGDGNRRSVLQARIDDEGLAERVRLLGAISQSQLVRLLPHCIVISPLTGMALIEAGLAGAPIVAYDHEWHAEFIDDGRSGSWYPSATLQ